MSNFTLASEPQSTFYLSPGIQISWNFCSSILVGVKISFGKMVEEEYYYNLTIGRKSLLGKNKLHTDSDYLYCEIQGGSFLGYYPLSAGAGLGATIFTENKKINVYPKLTLFGGAGIFMTFDYISGKNFTDIGLEAVLPIAFDESYRNLRQ